MVVVWLQTVLDVDKEFVVVMAFLLILFLRLRGYITRLFLINKKCGG